MFRNEFVWSLLLIGLLVLIVPAVCLSDLTQPPANMPHYVSIYAGARAMKTNWDVPSAEDIYNSGWVAATTAGTPQNRPWASTSTGSGVLGAQISGGTLRGSAFASANYQAGFVARGIAFANLYWGDTLTVTSSTLPYGTPVTLLMTMVFDATTYTSATPWAYGVNDAQAQASFWLGSDAEYPNQFATITYRDFQPPSNRATMTVHTGVGHQLSIHGEAYFNALAGASSTNTSTHSTADLTDTAHYYVDVQTAGASYVTHSGESYITPVPEPSALMALAAGLAGLAPLAIRRKSV